MASLYFRNSTKRTWSRAFSVATGFGANEGAIASQNYRLFVDRHTGQISESDFEDCLILNATPGTFLPTPASRIAANAVAEAQLSGIVIDWGCGGGLLALIAAAKPDVKRVIGLDYEDANVKLSSENAHANKLDNKIVFHRGDSFECFDEIGRIDIDNVRGRVDYIICNPPASDGDGFGFRRRVLLEAREIMQPNGIAFLQALSFYGRRRCHEAAELAGFSYQGVVKSSNWVELGGGQGGYDLRAQLKQYVDEEAREEGLPYVCGPEGISATETLEKWDKDKLIPFCQWHVHRFEFLGK